MWSSLYALTQWDVEKSAVGGSREGEAISLQAGSECVEAHEWMEGKGVAGPETKRCQTKNFAPIRPI